MTMGKFMSIYVCALSALVTIVFPPFVAGMIRGSLNSNHIDTAMIDAGALVLVWPLLLAGTITAVQSTRRMFFSRDAAEEA